MPRRVGSGFIRDAGRHIVTNDRVVENASRLTVTFQDGTTAPAILVGRDAPNEAANLKVVPYWTDDQGHVLRDRLQTVLVGDSDQVLFGEDVVAIGSTLGHPLGLLARSGFPGEDTSNASLDVRSVSGIVLTAISG
jgi:S1-C subfamily serine protease